MSGFYSPSLYITLMVACGNINEGVQQNKKSPNQ